MISGQAVARFEIPYRGCLASDGNTVRSATGFAVTSSCCGGFYRVMVRARVFDTKAVNLQRTGSSAPIRPASGTKPRMWGWVRPCAPEDVLFTVYREIGTKFWARGRHARHPALLGWGRTRHQLPQ